MAFELIIQEQSVSADGSELAIKDISDWTQETRANFGLTLYADGIAVDLTATSLVVVPDDVDKVVASEWDAILVEDGRINATLYSHNTDVSGSTPADQTVAYLTDTDILSIYDTGAWRAVTEAEAIASAVHTSNLLNLSILVEAYNYKNKINLEYVTQIKNDLAHGVQQNELYYKRVDLDYVTSLIAAAELNFGMELYTIYYDIVTNLNTIESTGNIS